MSRLQEFGFEQSRYERPNQKWVCGRARDGQCCLAGPDEKGNCTATSECRPLRKGDRWFCSRPAFLGGPCPDGPLSDGRCCREIPKCSPVRSLRSWRGLTVLLAVSMTLAAMLVALGSKHGNQVFSPGPLSFAHRSVSNNCSECHAGLEKPAARWLVADASLHSAHDNSQSCLNCHNLGKTPLQPHALPPDRLNALTRTTTRTNSGTRPGGLVLASFIASPGHPAGQDIACATCHREHRGEEADLKKITNDQCQSCHSQQFASLATGHPAFTHYPFARRTRIIFDHGTHLRGHFAESAVAKLAPKLCVDCHQSDLRGGMMVVKPYETACAACHDDQIKSKAAVKPGIAFLGLPRLDDRNLTGEYSIGEWPEDADQPLTPFLRLVLAADPDLRAALDRLQGVDLANLPKTDPAKLKAAQQLAWGIKSLIFDLGLRGQEELIRRINVVAGRNLADPEKEGVVAFLGVDVVRDTFRGAFPNLAKEVLDYRNNHKAAATQLVPSPELAKPGPVKPVSPDNWVSQGGWYSPEGSFAIFYHPRGHHDRFLSSWMNLTVDVGHSTDPARALALFKELTAPKAVGYCAKCHSIDESTVSQVNWLAFRPDPAVHGFNRFSHSAHLSLLDPHEGCLTCHSMTEAPVQGKDSYASAFATGQHDPAQFISNFKTIDKAVCANCHRPTMVRDDCLLCHNYHIGRFNRVMTHTDMSSVLPKSAVK